MATPVRILVVGLGNMGQSHAKAYHALDGVQIVGLCSRNATSMTTLPDALSSYPRFDDYRDALERLQPDAVSINTWPGTHADFAVMALDAGAHMFLEKPLAKTVEEAERAVAKARETGRKLVVGYILRHHPSWQKFVDIARGLGTPLVMRMNLNQQSSGETWAVHKHLMESLSPIVDCGVHYVDMMCLMMSETAFFVKDVIGPKGCVSIVAAEASGQGHRSDDVDAHTKSDTLRVHHGALDEAGRFARADEVISMADEPGHDDLCRREQDYFLSAIRDDIDLSEHLRDAVNSLRIVLAADASVRSGNSVAL